MRSALLALLFAACTQAGAQPGMLVSPLPDLDSQRILEITRQVLAARGWTEVPEDRSVITAQKDHAEMRIFLDNDGLHYNDQSRRAHGHRQRNREEGTRPLAAVPQTEVDALRADLLAAFEGGPRLPGGKAAGRVLVPLPAGADSREVMKAAREAFVGRRWTVKEGADAAFVASIRGVQDSATLKVFVADGALRFIDMSTDRRGAKTQAPERWLNNIRADMRQPIAREATPSSGDAAERLRKLKALLDDGLITQSEYDAKRAEILKNL